MAYRPQFAQFNPQQTRSRVTAPTVNLPTPSLITAPSGGGGSNWFTELLGEFLGKQGSEFAQRAWDYGVDSLFDALPTTEGSSAPNLLEGLDARYQISPALDQATPEGYDAAAQPPKEPVEASGAEAVVRQAAEAEGVDPDVLVSVWQQESSGSTDLGLRGQTLPEGHKYAGHYARGPFQIMSFHGEIPEDFAGQARWAARHLKERGVAGYYGSGSDKPVTGMPGQPTGADYVAQVEGRAEQMRNASGQAQPPIATRETGQQAVKAMQADSQFQPRAQQEGEVSPGFWEYASGSWQRQQEAAAQRQRAQLNQLNLARGSLALKQEYDDMRDEQAYLDRLTPAEADDYRAAKYGDPQATARQQERARREQLRVGGEPEVRLGPQGERMNWDYRTGQYVPTPGMPSVQPSQPAAPSGYQWNQQGGVEPIPGTAEAVKRDERTRSVQSVYTALDELDQLVATKGEGLDLLGDRGTQTEMRVLADEVMVAIGQLSNAGVLQVGDVERLQKLIPDPTAKFTWGGVGDLRKAYVAIRQAIERRSGVAYGGSGGYDASALSAQERAELEHLRNGGF